MHKLFVTQGMNTLVFSPPFDKSDINDKLLCCINIFFQLCQFVKIDACWSHSPLLTRQSVKTQAFSVLQKICPVIVQNIQFGWEKFIDICLDSPKDHQNVNFWFGQNSHRQPEGIKNVNFWSFQNMYGQSEGISKRNFLVLSKLVWTVRES